MTGPLKELKARWLCEECDETCIDGEVLTAPNPFDPQDTVTGCPHCKSISSLIGACQAEGCRRMASSGNPKVGGFRYVWACLDHSPIRGLWPGADPALVEGTP